MKNNRERDRDETVRLSEMGDSLKRGEKSFQVNMGIQTVPETVPACEHCERSQQYCEFLIEQLNKVEEATK